MPNKTAREIYGASNDSTYSDLWEYDPIIESFGDVLLKVDDNDCQGDSRAIIKSGDRYGWLQFGWGSCSGCDALQACCSYDEVDDLIERLRGDIRWFDSLGELKTYFEEKDWEVEYDGRSAESIEFRAGVASIQ